MKEERLSEGGKTNYREKESEREPKGQLAGKREETSSVAVDKGQHSEDRGERCSQRGGAHGLMDAQIEAAIVRKPESSENEPETGGSREDEATEINPNVSVQLHLTCPPTAVCVCVHITEQMRCAHHLPEDGLAEGEAQGPNSGCR